MKKLFLLLMCAFVLTGGVYCQGDVEAGAPTVGSTEGASKVTLVGSAEGARKEDPSGEPSSSLFDRLGAIPGAVRDHIGEHPYAYGGGAVGTAALAALIVDLLKNSRSQGGYWGNGYAPRGLRAAGRGFRDYVWNSRPVKWMRNNKLATAAATLGALLAADYGGRAAYAAYGADDGNGLGAAKNSLGDAYTTRGVQGALDFAKSGYNKLFGQGDE